MPHYSINISFFPGKNAILKLKPYNEHKEIVLQSNEEVRLSSRRMIKISQVFIGHLFKSDGDFIVFIEPTEHLV